MKKGFAGFLIVFSFILSGCVAVPLMGPAFLAYSEYQNSKTGEIDFRIKRNDPDAQSLQVILRASTLAIFPSRQGSDGDDVDLFRQSTNLGVVSSTKTIEWVDRNKISPQLRSMPSSERAETVAKMSRSVGADLGLFVLPSKGDVEVKGFMTKSLAVSARFTTYIVDAKTAKVLWVEDQGVFVESGLSKTPETKEVNVAAAKGIASRLMDLRLGRNPTAAKDA